VFPESFTIGNNPRRECFNVRIFDDDIYEKLEIFTVILELDSFVIQSGVVVDPNVTIISIEDNDSMQHIACME
jgi:hypothetical protein